MPDLNVLRISRDTESSSTLVRHRSQLEDYDARHGRQVAAWVEDATVSGSVNLVERKSLGRYLQEPLVHTWDTMKVVNQARITRDDMHWWAFVGWCLKNNKTIIILDDPSFEIETEDGRMIAGIKASQAAKYRKAVQKDRLNQLQYYREHDLWPGGKWPFGYRAVRDLKHKGEFRYRLVIDPVTAPLVREAYQRITAENHGLAEIVRDWNNRGVLTAMDHQRSINAQSQREGVQTEIKGHRWGTATLGQLLSRPTLMGYAIQDGETRTRDGLPVKWADPILELHEFNLLQAVLERRGKHMRGLSYDSDPLSGVLFHSCELIMHASSSHSRTDKVYLYYRCSSQRRTTETGQPACERNVSWPREFLRDALEEEFLDALGSVERTSRKFIPGHDRTSEIKELKSAIDNLAQAVGQAKSATVIESLGRTMESHAENLAALESEPVIPPRWEESATGETYREVWARLDWPERGRLLRGAGVRLYVSGRPSAPDLHLYTPEDLQRRSEDVLAGSIDPSFTTQWEDQIRLWRSRDGVEGV